VSSSLTRQTQDRSGNLNYEVQPLPFRMRFGFFDSNLLDLAIQALKMMFYTKT
jgi:hypothetical protein